METESGTEQVAGQPYVTGLLTDEQMRRFAEHAQDGVSIDLAMVLIDSLIDAALPTVESRERLIAIYRGRVEEILGLVDGEKARHILMQGVHSTVPTPTPAPWTPEHRG